MPVGDAGERVEGGHALHGLLECAGLTERAVEQRADEDGGQDAVGNSSTVDPSPQENEKAGGREDSGGERTKPTPERHKQQRGKREQDRRPCRIEPQCLESAGPECEEPAPHRERAAQVQNEAAQPCLAPLQIRYEGD